MVILLEILLFQRDCKFVYRRLFNELKRLIEENVKKGEKIQIELTPTFGNEPFYEKAGFKYKPDKITGMYLWVKK